MWKRLLYDDLTILALVSVMAFFDDGAPNLQEQEKNYCRKMFWHYSKLLDQYCMEKLMPVTYIDIIFNFSSITAKRQHSSEFIKKLSSKIRVINNFFEEMKDSWLLHVDL